MWIESLAAQSLTAFFVTLAALSLGAPIAKKIGLVDAPSQRKRHSGEIPLVGGLSVFISLAVVSLIWGDSNSTLITVNGSQALWVFMGCGAILVMAGAIDDRFQLSISSRVFCEIGVSIIVVEMLDLQVAYLGDLVGLGIIQLPPSLAYAFTIVAIFGIINAFNMLDGVDGLVAMLVIVTLMLFHLLTEIQPGSVSLSVGASLMAFIVSNFELTPFVPKTFLGDAGSKLLGFIVVCLLLAAASAQVGQTKAIQPVTALFLVSIPLYDMVFTSIRRVVRGVSPFSSDRSHIHHLLQQMQLPLNRVLFIVLSIHLTMALLGLVLHRASTPEYYQLAIFSSFFLLYCVICSQLWAAVEKLQDGQSKAL